MRVVILVLSKSRRRVFTLWRLGLRAVVFPEYLTTPTPQASPRACRHFFVFTNINHISLMLVALSIVGVD
jgi:hypothetical protein